MKYKIFITICVTLICNSNIIAQKNLSCNLFFSLSDYSSTTLTLANYYGKKLLFTDTVNLDRKGQAIKELSCHEGMYVLILPDSTFFEFMITETSEYHISERVQDRRAVLNLTGNPITEAYVSYQNQVQSYMKKTDSLKFVLKQVNNDQRSLIRKQISEYKSDIDNLSTQFIIKYEETLPANYIKALMPSKLKTQDSAYKPIIGLDYQYFENISWTDDRLIYTPVIEDKISIYLDKLASKNPELLVKTIDIIISLPQTPALKDFVKRRLLEKYSNSKNHAINEYAYIHLLKNYFLFDNENLLSKEEKDVYMRDYNMLETTLLLNQSPEITLPDKDQKMQSLSEIESDYTLLFFWDYSCEACRRVLTDLVSVMSKYNYTEIKVYTVCTGDDRDIWKAFLAKKIPETWVNTIQNGEINYAQVFNLPGLPAIFLLDGNKKIISKNFTIPELDTILFKTQTQ
jgi:thiol-disulfide isomerase/thioredoxin